MAEAASSSVEMPMGVQVKMEKDIDYLPMKFDIKVEEDADDDCFQTMDFLELAACSVETNQEPIEFNSTDAAENPKNGQMVCLHCLEDVEKNALQDHMVNAHGYKHIYFKCQICCSIFKERDSLTIHKSDCRVPVKKKIRKSMNQLIREVEAIVAEDCFEYGTCPVCMMELPKGKLKDHLITEHKKKEDENPRCEKCHRDFKNRLTLREHVRLVHESIENSVCCDQCGQKFRSNKYLQNHKRNVHPRGDKVHQCDQFDCGKVFKSRLCLHQHIKYVHPPESASAECPLCSKIFKTRINLQQHIKVSHNK